MATEISISASVGRMRWLNVSLVITQKEPSRRSSWSPIVLIGRLRMTDVAEYSAHDCIARSTNMTTPISNAVTAPVRADWPLSKPPTR